MKLYSILEDGVSEVFENNLDKKKVKPKIPRHIKKLHNSKSKISKKILKTRCLLKLVKLRYELEEIECELSENKEKWRKNNELKVIEEIKLNPAVFYRYAKSKAVVKSDIGPLKSGYSLVHEVNKMI